MVAGILGEPPKPCQLFFQILIKSRRRIVMSRRLVAVEFAADAVRRSKARDQNLECDSNLIRADLRACVAHSVSVGGVSFGADRVGVETIVRSRNDLRSVTVNINVARGRSAPREVYRVSPLDFVASRI